MNLDKKVIAINDMFTKEGWDNVFQQVDSDDGDLTIFKSMQDMQSGRCGVFIWLDNSPYTLLEFRFAKLDNLARKDQMLSLLNDLNQKYKTLRFFMDDENNIVAQVMYAAGPDQFNTELFFNLLRNSFHDISDNDFPKVMRIIYG